MIEYIEVDKDLIPYRFETELTGKTYTFEILYNSEYAYFSLNVYLEDEEIVMGEKLLIDKPLFDSCLHLEVPLELIVPLDLSGEAERITWENLNDKVFLYILGEF